MDEIRVFGFSFPDFALPRVSRALTLLEQAAPLNGGKAGLGGCRQERSPLIGANYPELSLSLSLVLCRAVSVSRFESYRFRNF